MSWKLLERFIESDHFNNDPSLAVAYLARYHRHVGIQYVLCSKLRQFTYEEIEFFLPQLCHLLVSVDHESMALEEFMIDLCQESVSGALITFWLFQTHLHDLSSQPSSNSFKTCRRVFNKVQSIVFGASEPLREEKIHENILPTTVFASIILAGVAAPLIPGEIGPLAVAQARRPQPLEGTISEAPPVQKVNRSHTVNGPTSGRARRPKSTHSRYENWANTEQAAVDGASKRQRPSVKHQKSSRKTVVPSFVDHKQPHQKINSPDTRFASPSLSNLNHLASSHKAVEAPSVPNSPQRPDLDEQRRHSHGIPAPVSLDLPIHRKVQILRSHYFRSETQFLSALEGISNRLVALPKPARLSALRAELALIARDLPAEVDIPLICPATLDDGIPSQSKHHRIVRLNPAESTSLNSAERVPYLLMVEVLRDDFDFDPNTVANQNLLSRLIAENDSNSRRRPFDITDASRNSIEGPAAAAVAAEAKALAANKHLTDSVFEPATGDLSSPDLLKDLEHHRSSRPQLLSRKSSGMTVRTPTTGVATSSLRNSPAPSNRSSRRTSESPVTQSEPSLQRRQTLPPTEKATAVDQPNYEVAAHMRTAAQMLAQLDVSGSKRPRQEVENIKTKIIASMQNLEEQNFTGESPKSVDFEKIMANVEVAPGSESPIDTIDGPDDSTVDGNVTNGAGAARMENDQVIGGVRRKGDRDDPSAATFGEDWKSKKDRIRRTSPYGWMKNWDLLSVIVKTGSDLRQELFACQLIRICGKIWEDAKVPVWVKHMRILVTGESSGLIETITNGVSLHSIKRSLTLASIAAGTNPRKRFATLKDHFVKAFGEVDSPAYKAGEDAFARSLAGYSILSYILQLKDRHNGNILVDNQGHMVHIDFGFMLSNSPGSVGFEAAPFKLTHEYVDVLGGVGSPGYETFKDLCKHAFQALRKSADNIIMLVELMSKESKMACFTSGALATTTSLRQRFMLHLSKEEAENFVDNDLIGKSLGSYYTRL
ncbi:MAG: Phosphatidylinositol 4-kinase pik1alpha (PI4-kinase)(PtdIns-4-kinase) [Alyxoria varia]|nr:MAG: Phosphatidylinositol 4-kinase pik1alpha (PI4-kinase)(PtdIns-4-kinase) [Alyxoria varia]